MNAPLPNPFRGKLPLPRPEVEASPITRDDLQRLLLPRDSSAANPKRIKEAHHTVARLLALGFEYARVAELTGYSGTRIATLASAPAMAELIAQYRADINNSFMDTLDVYHDLMVSNKLKAERMIADRLEEAQEDGDVLPFRDLLAISRDAADRTGHPKGRVNINTNADFASLLEQRIARAKTVEAPTMKTVEAIDDKSSQSSPSVTAPSESEPLPFRRIA